MVLAAHTIVKQICDFAMAIFGTFSTVAQSLVATCLGKVLPEPESHGRAPAHSLQSTSEYLNMREPS